MNLVKIHEDTICARVVKNLFSPSADKADRYLPVSFTKHTQGVTTIK